MGEEVTRIITELPTNLSGVICSNGHGEIKLKLQFPDTRRCKVSDCSRCSRRFVSWQDN
jgi:hypothetical protein